MSRISRFLLPLTLLIVGGIAAYFLLPNEQAAVDRQMIGYPDSAKNAHQLRVYLLGLLCAIPFLCNLAYLALDTIDRYTIRIFLNSFFICFGALFMIMMLEDLQDNLSDFKKSSESSALMLKHYLTKLPALIVFILPYSLMLALLWSLGRMSKSQEIVSIIQTGRGVFRFTRPLIGAGIICSIICLIFNYYWAPNAEQQEDLILKQALGETTAAAHDVAYQTADNSRHWLVGEFPFDHSKGAPIKHIEITVLDENHKATSRIISEQATWSLEDRTWTLQTPIVFDLQATAANDIPIVTVHTEDLVTDWAETPFQIVKPGLKAPYLGVPGLISWCKNHVDHPLSDKRSYITHLSYRFAQPFICIIIILLAAPLGIVFSRRGVGGGVAVAIFLCAGMIFCSTVFPTLGESGHLHPFLAAWATNLLFTLIALYLFRRRMSGQPIYQILKNLFPTSN